MPQARPSRRPARPFFGSGPTAKRPGWSIGALRHALVGRSHRSTPAKARIGEVIERSRALLNLPPDHRLGIVPASDTGAFEMAMWNLLGPRGVDLVAFESFGQGWVSDVVRELRLADVRTLSADYGALPDCDLVAPDRDVVFTWNGTTSGVRVPDAAWIADDRSGLTLCDATSAVFAMPLDWAKLDVATYSWQKVLGGEAQHGVLILGPRAVERLESFRPERPLPKIFRLTKGGRLIEGIFKGETINTPSMLAVEDALDGLRWAEAEGGLEALIRRADANLAAVEAWVGRTGWIEFLASRPALRSSTSICLRIVDPRVQALPDPEQRAFIGQLVRRLEQEEVACDIAAYRDAPPGLRLWGGATVEREDLEALFPWLDWAFEAGLRDL
ncbi:MAG TPA: phosphoserine transaminase [Geminicoccaceae bacterium]